jgi:5-methylcytosine-specific restriction endonuclease McrA
MVLHVDHVDGNSDNHVPSNLRFLCPNCHSQTDTYSWRNVKRKQLAKVVGEEGFEPDRIRGQSAASYR